jgi:hypothetical protein
MGTVAQWLSLEQKLAKALRRSASFAGSRTGRCPDRPDHSRCVPIKPGKHVKCQVTALWWRVCKTVGTAYVGSNPTPATCECPGQSLARDARGTVQEDVGLARVGPEPCTCYCPGNAA